MKKRAVAVCIIAIIVVGIAAVWSLKPSGSTRAGVCPQCNIIVVSVDTLAARDLSCFGNAGNTAPNICSFAGTSVLFRNTYASDTWTLPNLASIFTSQLPSTHAMLDTGRELNPRMITMAQFFKRQGYNTFAVGLPDDRTLASEKGLGRGFDGSVGYTDIIGSTDALRQMIRKSLHTPVFFYLNIDGTDASWRDSNLYAGMAHFSPAVLKQIRADLQTPDKANSPITQATDTDKKIFEKLRSATDNNQAERYFNEFSDDVKYNYFDGIFFDESSRFTPEQFSALREVYNGRIARTDRQLAEFFGYLRESGVLKNSIVVIAGIHGESFGNHGTFAHANNNLYDEVVHVPLLMSIPGISHRTIDDLVATVDLFPTLAGLTGNPPPPNAGGINLTDRILGKEQAQTNEFVISEHGLGSSFQMIRNADWSLHITDDDETTAKLFNLKDDPLEQTNIAAGNPEQVLFMDAKLTRQLWRQPLVN